MTLADALITAAILAAACWLLYRSLWVRRGACAGCSSAGSCRGEAPRAAPALVPLGRRAAPPPPASGDRP